MKLAIIFLLFIPCYVISAVIHEFGHIIVGVLNGFKFHLLVVGPLGIKRKDDDKLAIYIEKNPALWGGVGAALPQNNNDKNYDVFAKVLLGGPISSIIFSVIFIPIGIVTDNIFFILLGFMSLGMGSSCLIPMKNGCFYSDGGRWLRIRRKGQDGLVEMAIWNITQTYILNGDFSNINVEETKVLKNDKESTNQYLGYYYAYNHYKDINDFENAEKEKEQISELVQQVPKNFLKLFPIQ